MEGLDLPILGDIGAAVAGLVLAGEAIFKILKSGFQFLQRTSPILARSIDILGKGLGVLLRPIGDALSLFIKPFAIAMLKFAIPIYKKWREFLEDEKTQAQIQQINIGAGKIAEGIITLDFEKVKEGLTDVLGGIKNLALGFFGFVGGELEDFSKRLRNFVGDAWDFFKEKFGGVGSFIGTMLKSGILGIINLITGKDFESFGDILSSVFVGAWNKFWDFIKSLTPESWREAVGGLVGGLSALWDEFSGLIEKYDWAGPLAPLFAAIELAWDNTAGNLVDVLKEKFDESIPGFSKALEFLTKDKDGGGEKKKRTGVVGIFQTMSDSVKNLRDKLFPDLKTGLSNVKSKVKETIGEEKNETGKTFLGALNKTIQSLQDTSSEVDMVRTELDKIPREIITVHKIVTVFE